MRPLPIEPLAGTPSFVVGVSVVRGSPIPVIDAARLLGCSDSLPAARWVAMRVGSRAAALAVDEVLGVTSLTNDALGDLPPILRRGDIDFVEAIGTLDRELLLVLNSARLVPPSVWAALDGRRSVP
jgi:purine-binding chemotaxis protein CheW